MPGKRGGGRYSLHLYSPLLLLHLLLSVLCKILLTVVPVPEPRALTLKFEPCSEAR